MLHDLLFALLGFPGDVIIEDESNKDPEINNSSCRGKFHVKDGYPGLTEPEREQVDAIAPLGWYHNAFENYIRRYDMSWGNISSDAQIYKMALCAALRDLLQEYLDDIAELEALLNKEQSLPLSHFVQHLRKVSIVYMVHIHSITFTSVSRSDLTQLIY